MIRIQARETYKRDLQINQRIRYVNSFLLAKAWYLAQTLPPRHIASVKSKQLLRGLYGVATSSVSHYRRYTNQKNKEGGDL